MLGGNGLAGMCGEMKLENVMSEKIEEKTDGVQRVRLAGREVPLDPELLKFDEHTLNKFLQEFAGHYNVYYQHHADAQFVHSKYEDVYEKVFSERFRMYREESSSDKMAEMKTKSDPDVQSSLETVRIAKRTVNLLWGYLRSMDRAHDDAVVYSHNLRKEMDKLFRDNVKYTVEGM